MKKNNKVKYKYKNKKKGLFYKILRFFVLIFYRKRKFTGIENVSVEEPVVFISNHCQLHSPLATELFFPFDKAIWCNGEMMNVREIPSYAYKDFWSNKPKGIRWFFKGLSYLIAPVGFLFKSADAIPVYRDLRITQTFKKSIEALNEGCNIVIFPEKAEGHNNIINDLNLYFVDLAKFYYKTTGKELSFVPMYNAHKLKTICFGKPIKFDSKDTIENQRTVICEYLKDEITSLAQELPVHTVIPFNNVPKKQYKKSK